MQEKNFIIKKVRWNHAENYMKYHDAWRLEMPALNFKKVFAPLVESGEKTQTIRALRKDGRNPRPGERLFLYTGMRTKGCRKLGETICNQRIHQMLGTGRINNTIGAGTGDAGRYIA